MLWSGCSPGGSIVVMSKGIWSNVIAAVIGALASLLVERSWKRHKAKQARQKEPET